jgi:hypothetical protein
MPSGFRPKWSKIQLADLVGAKVSGNPESCDKGRVCPGDDLGGCTAQASVREPFLNRHNSLGLLGGGHDGILIDRLDGAERENPGLYALGSQQLGGRKGHGGERCRWRRL